MKQFSDYADIFIEALFYPGYLWMADKFFKKYLGTTKKKELLFVVLSFGGWLFFNMVNSQYHIPHIFSAILYHILFTGLVFLFFRAGWEKKILAVSMVMLSAKLVANILVSFLSCLALFFQHTVKKIPDPLVSEWEGRVITCVSFCMVTAVLYWMAKHLTSVFCGKSGKWYVILAIPMFMIIILSDVADWGACNGIMFRSGGNMGLYYDQIFSYMGFGILALLSMTAAGVYVFGMERIYLEQKKNSQYHEQIAVYKMLTEQYRQSERLRHDMKNHIIALSGLFQNREWEKMGDYLKKMENGGLETDGDMTGSKAVDALLYQKRKRAQAQKIKWECDVQVPKIRCINEFDLCVLFGNLLDNALEACEKLQCGESQEGGCRFVNIQAGTVKRCFLLEIKNSMDGTQKQEDRLTGKENPREHGIGLLNVADVVHGYNGVMNREVQDGIFAISILLPLNEDVHDIKTTD